MKKIDANLMVNIAILIVGIVFLVLSGTNNLMEWVARILGVLFLIPSVVFMIVGAIKKTDATKSLYSVGIVPAAGGLFFGISMLKNPEQFTSNIIMLTGLLLCVLALYQVVNIFKTMKVNIKLPMWYVVFPCIGLICGLLIMLVDGIAAKHSIVVIMVGVSFLLHNVASLLVYICKDKVKESVVVQLNQNNPEEVKAEVVVEKASEPKDEAPAPAPEKK